MKKTILFYSLFFIFALSYANTNLDNSIPESTFGISKQITKSIDKTTIDNITIKVTNLDDDSCTISITGRIGYNSTYVEVNISITAATCKEAEDEAWASLARQKKRLKAFVDSM